jgi:hypothetical protein
MENDRDRGGRFGHTAVTTGVAKINRDLPGATAREEVQALFQRRRKT